MKDGAAALAILFVATMMGCGSSSGGVSITITPTSAAVPLGHTQQFIATVKNTSNTAVTWQVNGVVGGQRDHRHDHDQRPVHCSVQLHHGHGHGGGRGRCTRASTADS